MIHANFPVIISINYFVVVKKCLPLGIHGWLGKTQWKIITWKKKHFNSHLNMKDTDADYTNAKRVCKEFEIKNLGKYHDLYVQSDT